MIHLLNDRWLPQLENGQSHSLSIFLPSRQRLGTDLDQLPGTRCGDCWAAMNDRSLWVNLDVNLFDLLVVRLKFAAAWGLLSR